MHTFCFVDSATTIRYLSQQQVLYCITRWQEIVRNSNGLLEAVPILSKITGPGARELWADCQIFVRAERPSSLALEAGRMVEEPHLGTHAVQSHCPSGNESTQDFHRPWDELDLALPLGWNRDPEGMVQGRRATCLDALNTGCLLPCCCGWADQNRVGRSHQRMECLALYCCCLHSFGVEDCHCCC